MKWTLVVIALFGLVLLAWSVIVDGRADLPVLLVSGLCFFGALSVLITTRERP